jgi:hypothetical protein
MTQCSGLVVWCLVFTSAGCAGAQVPAAPLPDAVVLRIDTVEVAASPTGTTDTWDGRAPEHDPMAGCKVFAAGTTLVSASAGGVLSALCGLANGPQEQQPVSNPDLQVAIAAGSSTRYATYPQADTLRDSLQYEIVVPLAAIPDDGLRFEAWDHDVGGRGPQIGQARVSRSQLADALQSSSPRLVLSDGALRQMEVVISAYTPARTLRTTRDATSKPTPLGRPIRAGEVVSVKASGSYKVGSWFDASLDPAGYPGGEARSYNLEPFRKAPHACAIALVGLAPSFEGVVIGQSRTFVAAHGGPLRLGLNDADPSNNAGFVSYEVSLRAPTVDEWLRGGSSEESQTLN